MSLVSNLTEKVVIGHKLACHENSTCFGVSATVVFIETLGQSEEPKLTLYQVVIIARIPGKYQGSKAAFNTYA